MNTFTFDPANGFRDASVYRNPQSEDETRNMFQTPLDQIKDYLNNTVVADASSKDTLIEAIQRTVADIEQKEHSCCQASGDLELLELRHGEQTQIPLSASKMIQIGTGYSIEHGGIRVSKAGYYKVSGSVYLTSKSGGFGVGAYIRRGVGSFSESGTEELVGSLVARLSDNSFKGGVALSPKVVRLEANDIVFLCGRSLNETKNGEAEPSDEATYLLVEYVE